MPSPRATDLESLGVEIAGCRACPRLVEWREQVARDKRAAFRDWDYWGRPVPGFGDPAARLLLVGLAPAAHGANRTGRMFTGDRSGDWLYRALHRAGFANQALAESRDDGLRLRGAWIAAAVRCAPPANRPTPEERAECRPYLEREISLLRRLRVVVTLGALAYQATWTALRDSGRVLPTPRPRFGHGVEVPIPPGPAGAGLALICSYHPSQQNTFTGTLTEEMLDAILSRARGLGA